MTKTYCLSSIKTWEFVPVCESRRTDECVFRLILCFIRFRVLLFQSCGQTVDRTAFLRMFQSWGEQELGPDSRQSEPRLNYEFLARSSHARFSLESFSGGENFALRPIFTLYMYVACWLASRFVGWSVGRSEGRVSGCDKV